MSVEVNLETYEITVVVDYQEKGEPGNTPIIGENGNWWINGIDTERPSQGNEGHAPEITIQDGIWFIDGVSTGQEAQGEDGHAPEIVIGENGNWFVDGVDTGQKAQGDSGVIGTEIMSTADYEALPNPNPDVIYYTYDS